MSGPEVAALVMVTLVVVVGSYIAAGLARDLVRLLVLLRRSDD